MPATCWSLKMGIYLCIKQGLCFLVWENLELDKNSYATCALRQSKGQMASNPIVEVRILKVYFNEILFTHVPLVILFSLILGGQ